MLVYRQGVYRRALISNVPTWEQLFDILVRSSEMYDDEIEELGKEAVFQFYAQAYEENLQNLQALEGEDCYRAIAMKKSQCNRDYAQHLDPLGVYWSHFSEGADTYWTSGEFDPPCALLYRARVSQSGVDIAESLRMNMINPDEDEIRFLPGTKLYVYDVTIFPGGMWSSDEEKVSIEAMRKC